MYSTDSSFIYTYSNNSKVNGVQSGLYYTYTGSMIGYANSIRKKYGLIFCYLRDIDTPLDFNSVSYFDPRRNREVVKENKEKYALVSYYYYNESENKMTLINFRSSSEQYVKFKTFKKNFKLYGDDIDVNNPEFKRQIRLMKIKTLGLY